MHFYKNGKKMDCYAQDLSVPFDSSKVEVSENVSGWLYVTGEPDADGVSPWRWLTADETNGYKADQEADHARHDDDGHGSAIGAQTKTREQAIVGGHGSLTGWTTDYQDVPPDTSEDDLGPKWGSVTVTEQPSEIAKAYASRQTFNVEGPADVLPAINDLVQVAKGVLDEVAADPMNTRFILLKVPMTDVSADGFGTPDENNITSLGTLGHEFLFELVQRSMMQALFDLALGDDIGSKPSSSLEI